MAYEVIDGTAEAGLRKRRSTHVPDLSTNRRATMQHIGTPKGFIIFF
jgi:hypothetical protein